MEIIPTNPPPNAPDITRKPQRQLTDVPIVHTLYETYCRWHTLLLKFPKSQRYTLGQTCTQYFLNILECVIGAAGISQRDQKIERLRTASAKLDALRLLVRLTKDTRCIPNAAYLDMESRLHEAGRMLGGWMKSLS